MTNWPEPIQRGAVLSGAEAHGPAPAALHVPDTLDLEYAARVVAYLPDGWAGSYALPAGYRLEAPITSANGFFAVPITSDTGQPILAVRGSVEIADLFTDVDPRGVGLGQVEGALIPLALWLADNPGVHVTGHSLGGAQAQIIAAKISDGTLGAGASTASVTTFNAPGISGSMADRFDPADGTEVRHFVAAGDLVSKAGQAFLPGDVALYHFDSLAGTDPADPQGLVLTQLLRSHTGHWAQPGMLERGYLDYMLPPEFEVFSGTLTVEQLGAPGFSYLRIADAAGGITFRDPDYELMLSVLSPELLGPGAKPALSAFGALLPFLPESFQPLRPLADGDLARVLEERESVEALRLAAGLSAEIGGFMGGFLTGGVERPPPAPIPGASLAAFLGSTLGAEGRDGGDRLQVGDSLNPDLGTGVAGSVYVTGPGPTRITMTEGFNTLFGLTAELDGDIVTGFGATDRIVIAGPELLPGNVRIVPGSATVTIDADGNGQIDATITLAGVQDITAFRLREHPDGVEIGHAPDETGRVEIAGRVVDRAGNDLGGATVLFLPEGGEATAVPVDMAGRFALDLAEGARGQIRVERDSGPGDPAPTTASALEALRLAVGLEPSWGPAGALDYLAADLDGDGRVTTADALEILRLAVGLAVEPAPRWMFVEAAADLSGIGRDNTQLAPAIALDALSAAELSFTGILVGHVQEFA